MKYLNALYALAWLLFATGALVRMAIWQWVPSPWLTGLAAFVALSCAAGEVMIRIGKEFDE